MLVLADRWGAAAKLGFLLTLAALPAANGAFLLPPSFLLLSSTLTHQRRGCLFETANDKFRFHLHGLAADTATVIDKEGNDVSAELHSVGRTKTGVSLEGVGGSRIDVIGAPPLGGDMTIVLVARRFSAAGASSESTCLFDISNGFATNNIQLCTASDDSQRLIFQVRTLRGSVASSAAQAGSCSRTPTVLSISRNLLHLLRLLAAAAAAAGVIFDPASPLLHPLFPRSALLVTTVGASPLLLHLLCFSRVLTLPPSPSRFAAHRSAKMP